MKRKLRLFLLRSTESVRDWQRKSRLGKPIDRSGNNSLTGEIQLICVADILADSLRVCLGEMESGEKSPLQTLLVVVSNVDDSLRKEKGMIKCTDFVFLFCQRSITFLCFNVGGSSTYDDPVNGWYLAMLTYRHMTRITAHPDPSVVHLSIWESIRWWAWRMTGSISCWLVIINGFDAK